MVGQDRQARGLGHLAHGSQHFAPQVDDGGDLDPRRVHVERRAVGAVVVGENHRRRARLHGVAVDVGAASARQHDAGAVVVAEHRGAFDRTGREHHLLGPQLPQAVARQVLGLSAEMVGDLLDQGQEVVIEVAVDGGAFEHPDLGQGAQLRLGRARPIQGRRAVDGRIRQAEQRPAQQMVLFRQHDPGAGPRRGEGGRQPGRPGTDHQHVAVGLCLVVAVRVALARRLAHAGGMTDEMLVLHPHGGGPHEGLVVEAGGKSPRRQIVQRADIVFQARPTVLGARREAVHQFD